MSARVSIALELALVLVLGFVLILVLVLDSRTLPDAPASSFTRSVAGTPPATQAPVPLRARSGSPPVALAPDPSQAARVVHDTADPQARDLGSTRVRAREFHLRGRVVGPDGSPPSEFWIAVSPATARGLPESTSGLWRFTGPDGAFAIELPEGRYRVTSIATGAAPSRPADVELSTESPARELILALGAGRTLAGRVVVRESGAPLPHAELVVAGARIPGGPESPSTWTDANGEFFWEHVPEVTRDVEVRRAGQSVGRIHLSQIGAKEEATWIVSLAAADGPLCK